MNQSLTILNANGKPDQPKEWADLQAPFELLSRVASMYYLEDKPQIEIAKDLGISRQKVQRLLQQARDRRIVEIQVHTFPTQQLHNDLARRFKDLFGLQDVVIAPFHPDEHYRRGSVARAAATYLEGKLRDGSVVAVGLGRNMGEIANFLHPARRIDATFVSAMGGSPSLGAAINPSEICRLFASRTGGNAEILYAPVYLESRSVHDMLIEQDSIKRIMNLARNADIALMGIGALSEDATIVQAGCISINEVHRLLGMGVVGEILGAHYDEKGQNVPSEMDGRMISLTLDELRKIPLTIAVVSEMEKSKGVLGALRTQAIRTLIVECKLAVEILRLAGVTDFKDEEMPLGL